MIISCSFLVKPCSFRAVLILFAPTSDHDDGWVEVFHAELPKFAGGTSHRNEWFGVERARELSEFITSTKSTHDKPNYDGSCDQILTKIRLLVSTASIAWLSIV